MATNLNHSQELEKEAKSMLTKLEYLLLLNAFNVGHYDANKQVNSMFDTADLDLNRNSITLRVRMKKGERELTVKEDAKDGGRLESNHRPLTIEEYNLFYYKKVLPNGIVKDTLNRLGIPGPYIYHGDLVTDRIEINYKGCKMALDFNMYLERKIMKLKWKGQKKMLMNCLFLRICSISTIFHTGNLLVKPSVSLKEKQLLIAVYKFLNAKWEADYFRASFLFKSHFYSHWQLS